jgi:hypothetical protein
MSWVVLERSIVRSCSSGGEPREGAMDTRTCRPILLLFLKEASYEY